jgi:hypothetical protein
MNNITLIFLSIFGAFLVIIGVLAILNFTLKIILKIQYKMLDRAKRKHARLSYELIKLTYEDLIVTRRLYHQSKSINDDVKKQEVQSKYIAAYKHDLEILSDPEYTKDKEYLTPEERKDLEETLALPRYKLI